MLAVLGEAVDADWRERKRNAWERQRPHLVFDVVLHGVLQEVLELLHEIKDYKAYRNPREGTRFSRIRK